MRVPVKLLGFVFWLSFFNCVQCQANKESCVDPFVKNGFKYKLPSNQDILFYSCNTGYKPITGNWWDSVTCREGSWSEEPRCIPVGECGDFPSVENGKLKQTQDREIAEVECDPRFKPTARFIKCVSGTWETAVCEVGGSCEIPPRVENAFIRSKPEELYVDGSSVTYICQKSFSRTGESKVFCRNGVWKGIPTCNEVTCPLKTEGDLRVERSPEREGPFKPEDKLSFSCKEQGMKLIGQREITCQSNGKWSSDVPICEEVTCPPYVEDFTVEQYPKREGPFKPKDKLSFSCKERGMKLKGLSEITCLPNGDWSSDFPKCEEIICVANLPANMKSDRHPGPEVSSRPGDTITLSCAGIGSELQGRSQITCKSNGEWSDPFPKCVGEKCGRPPKVEFADTVEITKDEYDSGERVEYSCFNKYTLVQRHPDSKYYTCEDGQWRGDITCLKPCSVTVDEMDKRGIELKWGGREKIFSPHEDRITFVCQGRKRPLDVNAFIQYCKDGEMILPECV